MARIETIGNWATLYMGDCRDILPTLSDIDAVVTDPPYGISETTGGPESRAREKGNYSGAFEDNQDYLSSVCGPVIRDCISIACRVAMTPGRTNIWHYPPASDIGCFYQPAASGVSFWGRPTWQPILFYGTAPNIGEQLKPLHFVLTEAAEKNGHPCPKPIGAWKWLLNKATKPDETVLDPFMGSGTTGVAAVNLGRRFIGIEIDREYFEIACRRIEAATKQLDMFINAPKPQQISLLDAND